MQTEKSKKSLLMFGSITILVIVVIAVLFGRNLISISTAKPGFIKTDKQRYHDAVKKHKNDDVIVRFEKDCAWEKAGKSIKLVQDLMIYDESDENKLFDGAGDIRVDASGNIYVKFAGEGKIKKYDSLGNFLLSMGNKGEGPGEIQGFVWSFDIYQDSLIYVLDSQAQRITTFTLDGNFIETLRLAFALGITYRLGMTPTGDLLTSYYDATSETILHQFDRIGNHLQSFGEPLYADVENLLPGYDSIKMNQSAGYFAFHHHSIFFSRNNPYEIIQFDEQGGVKMKIFREAKFMPPLVPENLGGSFRYIRPVNSSFLGFYKDILVNVVSIPASYENPDRTIIDFYDLNGQLLYTLKSAEDLYFSYIDKQGYVYGILRSEDDFSKLVRYKLELD